MCFRIFVGSRRNHGCYVSLDKKNHVNQFDNKNPEASLTFLSTVIRSHPKHGGFTMSQEAFIRDVIKNWEMTNCRPLVAPGEVTTVALPEEEEPDPEDILRAQRVAESPIWAKY